MVGAGWFKNFKVSTPADPSVPAKEIKFRLDHTQTAIADPKDLAGHITKNVPDQNCWNCHLMPTHDGGFKCCEPFDLSHNVVKGKQALGAGGCQECHRKPSPFFNRKILIDPFNRDGRPVYKEAWEILGYSRKRLEELTKANLYK